MAQEHGFCAKLTGAGGGGCAFMLLPPGVEEGAVQRATADLAALGFDARETVVGGPGLTLRVVEE